MILLDASGLLAALDPSQRLHDECLRVRAVEPGPFLLSPFVLAEVDYLLTTRRGPHRAVEFLEEVAAGAYVLEAFAEEDVAQAVDIIRSYRSLNLGLADASIVVLARRTGATDVLTLDERHFRSIEVRPGRYLRLLPADR